MLFFNIGWPEDQTGTCPGLFPHSIVRVFPNAWARPPIICLNYKLWMLDVKGSYGQEWMSKSGIGYQGSGIVHSIHSLQVDKLGGMSNE